MKRRATTLSGKWPLQQVLIRNSVSHEPNATEMITGTTFRFLSVVFVPIIKLKPTGKDQALERSIITASTG